jgi:amino acid adenylation domain-containing protein
MRTETYPLSPIQQGMLFHWLLDRHSGNDIEQMVVDLPEAVDAARLEAAWQQTLAAFGTLRTAFEWESDTQPMQRVVAAATLPFAAEDLRGSTPDQREARIAKYLRDDRLEGFDLSLAPAMRVRLFQLADSSFRMVWSFHHILIDGRSFDTVLEDVFSRYEGGSGAQAPDRPYREYIDWVEALDASASRKFWRAYLGGFTATTPLPYDRAGDTDREQFGQRHTSLSAEASAGLRTLAERENLSLNTIVLAAWALLLSRYSGEPDVVFGVTKTTRRGTIPDADDVMGLFLATIPLRVHVDPDLPLRAWLQELRRNWVSLRGQEHLPLVDIKQQTALPASAALFDSFVMFENEQIETRLRARGGAWSRRGLTLLEQPGLPLGLMAYGDASLALKIDYDARRFEASSIDRMLGHVTTVLESWARGTEGAVWQVPMLTESERRTLVDEWNRTAMPYSRDTDLAALVEEQVRRGPKRVAITFEDRDVTYGDLNERANRLAHHLVRRGVKPDALVGVCLERTPDLIIALLAVIKAGGAYVPLDPGFPRDRLAYMAEDAGLTVLVTARPFDAFFPDTPLALIGEGQWDTESADNPRVAVGPQHLGYVIYTSGSTGKPKGVEVTRGGFLNLIASMVKLPGMRADDSVLALTTASFDIAGVELVMPPAVGARIILADRETALNPEALRVLIERTAPTIVQATPVTFRMLFESGWRGDGKVKTICGGEAIPVDLGEALATASSEAWNGYGPTETTVYSAFHRIRRGDRVIYIGRPPANTTTYVLDPYRCLVPQGVTGELYIGGDGVARGYHNRPELTAEKFVPDPFRPGQIIYRTGDLARYAPDGTIECLGRTDHQVKIRGFRIELGEIETLLKQRADVRQAVVIAREDQPGDKRLVGYLVPEKGKLDPLELRQYLRGSLPDYMVPAAFVQLEALPTTPNGKIDRRALPAPDAEAGATARTVRPPRTEIEKKLTAIWEDVFQTSPVGLDDSFWDLGGHSMLAVKMMSRIGAVFGRRLPLNALFTSPTVEHLARTIADESQAAAGRHTLVEVQHGTGGPPVYWIPGGAALGMFSHDHIVSRLGPAQPIYALGSAFPKTVKDIETVEDRAAEYLKLIRAVQPEGPYHFVGFCAGGMIGWEMAQQIRRAGGRVGLLGMINCYFPRHLESRLAAVQFKAQRLRHQLRQARAEGKDLLTYAREKVAARRASRAEQQQIDQDVQKAKREGFVDTGDWNDRVVLDATVEVVSQYQPEHYDGRISLFVSDDESLAGITREFDPRFAWTRYAADTALYPIKGPHEEVVKAPYVFALADAIDDALRKAGGT